MLAGMSPVEVLVGRYGLGTLLLWLTFFISQSVGRNNRKTEIRDMDLMGLSKIVLIGFLNGISMIMIFLALERLESSLTAMIISAIPVFTLVILTFMGEPLTQRKLLRLVMALSGLYLLINPSGDVHGTIAAVVTTYRVIDCGLYWRVSGCKATN